ncbi:MULTISPECIES: ABC transporter ATP-binding protein [Nocardiopsis]|uniref:ABC transporter ATP-binding protein n=1 Tax=Nocardiopsis lambiniae TaxID=3075539 RepID=A0ABU2M2Q3_9ACTN|nr:MULTISPECIES: ABC transporter ATP-binding protein [unclassified Nocardiopsis]MDE3725093.1 ABC transporter ATP-binding protein [Nocardiopsis sp. N85]MDT0326848.1 ABC transporter ATP-binding protein [Nocardiopsis sp. DSM 44743]
MTTTATEHLLTAEGITVRFGGLTALDDVDLRVRPGGVTGLIGPNGAGKTTLFNVLSGVLRPTSGTITWKGAPPSNRRTHHLARAGIARTFQGLNLFPLMTVLDNVAVGADRLARGGPLSLLTGLGRHHRDERELRERAMAALERFGVADTAYRLPGTLPYGVQKQVALARACVGDPELLLLDEPAGGLSGGQIGDLAAQIRELGRDMAVVLVEHHMDLVMEVCDHIVVLNFGRVISTGTPDEVRADPEVTRAYLGTTDDGNE